MKNPLQPDADSPRAQRIDVGLVVAACRGDPTAVNALWTQAYLPVLRLLVHLAGDRELARDLTQETLLVASQRLDQLRSAESFEAWLLKIARNTFVSARQQPKFRRSWSLDWLLEQPAVDHILQDPNDPIESYGEHELVWQAYARLSTAAREVIYLCHLAGYAGTEVAEILDISPSAVYQRLHRAQINFKRIHDQLTGVSVTPPSGPRQWEH